MEAVQAGERMTNWLFVRSFPIVVKAETEPPVGRNSESDAPSVKLLVSGPSCPGGAPERIELMGSVCW